VDVAKLIDTLLSQSVLPIQGLKVEGEVTFLAELFVRILRIVPYPRESGYEEERHKTRLSASDLSNHLACRYRRISYVPLRMIYRPNPMRLEDDPRF
jgi:hypothetical protein